MIPNTFRLGIFAPKSLTDIEIIKEQLFEKIPKIAHVSTNDVGEMLVARFCEEHKIAHTVYPIPTGEGGVFASNAQILGNSGLIIIFDDGVSNNANHVKEACEKSEKKYIVYKFKQDPIEVQCRKFLEKLNLEMSKDSPDVEKMKKMLRKNLYGNS